MTKPNTPSKGSKKGAKSNPSPPPPPPPPPLHLPSLPAALAASASALSPDEQKLLAYFIAAAVVLNGEKKKARVKKHHGKIKNAKAKNCAKNADAEDCSKNANHPPEFGCYCFRCYASFQARCDSSPNVHVITDILDAHRLAGAREARPAENAGDGPGSGGDGDGDAEAEESEEEEMVGLRRCLNWVLVCFWLFMHKMHASKSKKE